MSTIAIIGAGSGLGLAVAQRFGAAGFSVALISRTQENVDKIASQLRTDGITAQGFVADVRVPQELEAALTDAARTLGTVEVLQYSPVPAKEFMKPVLETSAADLAGPVEFSIYGPVIAVQQVLPGMRELGYGTILFINGGSAVRPNPTVAGTSIAFAGESAFAELLHDALKTERIHVGQLIIPKGIGGGDPDHDPAALAEKIWRIHTERAEFRTFVSPMS